MKKIEQFTNKYPIMKTLRFSLIPVGQTEENFSDKLLLETDKQRAEEYSKVKTYLDRYYRKYIDDVLSGITLEGLREYAEAYYQDEQDEARLAALEADLRDQIANALQGEDKEAKERYENLFKKTMIEETLPGFLTEKEELETVSDFFKFTTYFTGFYDNRRNLFSNERKSTSISFRCINDNLLTFLNNKRIFDFVKGTVATQIKELDENMRFLFSRVSANVETIEDFFDIDFYSFFLSQEAIDTYNAVIGGFTKEDGTKVQGLNEILNLHNQQNHARLPMLVKLKKQLLSDRQSISFIPDKFTSDEELLCAVNTMYKGNEGTPPMEQTVKKAVSLFDRIREYDLSGIYIKSGPHLTALAKGLCGKYNAFEETWNQKYDEEKLAKAKKMDSYYEKRKKAFNAIRSFDLENVQEYVKGTPVDTYYTTHVRAASNSIEKAYADAQELLTSEYRSDKRLFRNDRAIAQIKNLLDSIKELEWLITPLMGTGKEYERDAVFYGEFLPVAEELRTVNALYDKVRNYLTQKPYSNEKIKLNFNNASLLGGWNMTKEADYRSVLLREHDRYYLGILDKTCKDTVIGLPTAQDQDPSYEVMEYRQLVDPTRDFPKKFFARKNLDHYAPSDEILEIRKKGSYKKSGAFDLKDCHRFIDFYKDCIEKTPEWKDAFDFRFKDTEQYGDLKQFCDDAKRQSYSIIFRKVPKASVEKLVEKGSLFLFQIYNKDFSEYSKGTPNLHTMLFKELFTPENMAVSSFRLKGGGEMFYREKSIQTKEMIVHPAHEAIRNKNPLNPKKESTFTYDMIKDKRYTKRSFSLHVAVAINAAAAGQDYINPDVREALRECKDNYIIGIARGERNLIYICVIDGSGRIVEQYSLNQIMAEHNGVKHVTDYHRLLGDREHERDAARQNWTAVNNIKELKAGYLSHVIHKICTLIEKYDAVVALEDLSSTFKNSRIKVEKQIYQKFENQLISKLNYMVDKQKPAGEYGGLLKAYQLANNGTDFLNKGLQNGFVFYASPWYTNQIDPATGFVNLLRPAYKNVSQAQEFFSQFDSIRYNQKEDLFEFDVDYGKFPRTDVSFRKKWTVCSNGARIRVSQNKETGKWEHETVFLTKALKELFKTYDIRMDEEMKEQIVAQDSKGFFSELIDLLNLTLQMMNNAPGNEEINYMISPVKDKNGVFFDSRSVKGKTQLPDCADANGAYNIARKVQLMISKLLDDGDENEKKKGIAVTNQEWLEYVQDI